MGKRQTEIPGMERKKIAQLDTAAEAYVEARDERMKLTEKEVEARDALITVMKKHELTVYRDDDAAPPLIVTLVPGEDKVKVKVIQAQDDDGEDGITVRHPEEQPS